MTADIVLQGRQLSKAYSGVTVVEGMDIDVRAGRIRAVLGENGAGKSTVMKMLTGIVQPTSGEILLQGSPVVLANPRAAMDLGIGIVHQELQILPNLSVADNLMLVGGPLAPSGLRGSSAEKAYVESLLKRVGLDVKPNASARSLSAAQSQLLEIAKALALDSKVLIFDEPTSSLPPNEVERLLGLIEGLRAEGHAILYISHHLNEVKRIADDITVLRDGNLVGHYSCADLSTDDMIHLMVDRPVTLYGNLLPDHGSDVILKVSDAASKSVRGVDFELRAGEILGFAGLIGSGMHDAAMLIAGADKKLSGVFSVNGSETTLKSPADAAKAGIVIVPEERKLQGILPELSVLENFHIGRHKMFSRNGRLDLPDMRKRAEQLVRQFKVRLASLNQSIASLSGGNQQKVVVARCVQSKPQVLILSEPTRGVDVGAKDDIHQLVLELAKEGTSIIIVSSELEEVLSLSHRVVVFSEGVQAGILPHKTATPKEVMKLATPKRKENENVHERAA